MEHSISFEEKVLQGLGNLDKRMDGFEGRMDALDSRMDGLENHMVTLDKRMDGLENHMVTLDKRMDGFEGRLDSFETLTLRTNAILEGEVLKNIRILADGHMGLVQRLDNIENHLQNVEDLAIETNMTVNIIQAQTTKNTFDIEKLKLVKSNQQKGNY